MTPSYAEETLTRDAFWAGEYPRPVFALVTIAAGDLAKGAVLGRVSADDTFLLSDEGAVDGSEVPSAILYQDVDASGGAVTDVMVVLEGMVNQADLSFGGTNDADSVRWALRSFGIHIRPVQGV